MAHHRLGVVFCLISASLALCGCGKGMKSAGKTPGSSLSLSSFTPVLSIDSPAPGTQGKSGMQLSGKCIAGSPVEISGAGAASPITLPCENGAFTSLVPFSAGEGVKNIVVTQRMGPGGDKVDSRSFIKDSVPPDLQVLQPAENTASSSGASLSGTCESGLNVQIYGPGVVGQSQLPCNGGMFTTPMLLFSSTDGAKIIYLAQTDLAGNVSSLSRQLLRDSAPPVLTISGPAAGTVAPAALTVTGACESGLNVQLTGSGLAAPVSQICMAGQYSITAVLSAGDGSKSVMASSLDAAGNKTSLTREFVRLNDGPTITITQPAAGSHVRTEAILQGNCVNALPVSVSGQGLLAPLTATCMNSGYSITISFSAGDGPKNIVVAQTNASGKTGMDSRSFTRDSTPPTIKITLPMANSLVKDTAVLTGTCESGLPVVISGTGVTQASSTNCNGGLFTTTVNISAGEGGKLIEVGQTDAAGNPARQSLSLVRDSVAPALTITGPAADIPVDAGITLMGECEPPLNVNVSGSGLLAPVTQPCAASGLFSIQVLFTSGNGSKAVSASQTDLAGNKKNIDRTFNRNSPPPLPNGPQLYAMNCATCHGPLNASTKQNRNASQIQNAIAQIAPMKPLAALSPAEVEAIAKALSKTPGTPLTNPFTCTPGSDPAPMNIRRLTYREYVNTVIDLFGTNLSLADIEAELSSLPMENMDARPAVNLFDSMNAVPINLKLITAYSNLAGKIADVVTSSNAKMNSVAGNTCIGLSSVTDACLNTVLDGLGLRIHRRPLTAEEKAAYISLYRSGSSTADGFARLLHAALQSPQFLFLLETEGTFVAGRNDLINLGAYEVASRLSYALTGTMPDAQLLSAAANGSLLNSTDVQRQAERLMTLPNARKGIQAFYSQWYRLNSIPHIKAAANFTDGIDPLLFQKEAKEEIHDIMDQLIWTDKAGYSSLMTTDLAFPKGPSLARAYGVIAAAGPVRLPSSNRRGLLTRAGLLSQSEIGTTDPIKRGVRIRLNLLCDPLGAPPNNADAMGAEVDPLSSTRTQFAAKTSPAQCMTCHAQINPLGFALENYDAFGRFRTQESVNYSGRTVVHTINASVIPGLSSAAEPLIDGAVQLQDEILKTNKAPACLTKQWLQYNLGRPATPKDDCSLSTMYQTLTSPGGTMQDLFKSIASVIRTKKLEN